MGRIIFRYYKDAARLFVESVNDAWALSPTVEILTFDATADGMCDGMKNAPMRGTSVYVKEGDAWKITFGMVSPAGKM